MNMNPILLWTRDGLVVESLPGVFKVLGSVPITENKT